ncbi:MAG: MATE family efflux transporter, partial [Exilibacterium sp.]
MSIVDANMSAEIAHRKIFTLAWPMILSNISIPLLGIVDTAILGHLDEAKFLAAVAAGSTILTFLLWGF